MTSIVKEFIESYIELIDDRRFELFFALAIKELDHASCEELIHILITAGVDTPEDTETFLMKAALHDEIKYRIGIPSEGGKWARWMSSGYDTGDYKDWARAALQSKHYQVYHAPYGWEGDCEDYLILEKRIPLKAFIESENMEIYDQTGEPGPFNLQDFKLVTDKI